MEVMDYEKKYKNALEHAKECLKDGGISQNSIDYIESIFTELKESEDEKIRKAIIEHFTGSHTCMFPYKGFTKEQILAWLEKQGEQEFAMIQWKGDNLKEVIDFTGVYKDGFEKWFHNSWEEYEKYVQEHNNIFKIFNEDGSHIEVPVGAWIVKTPDGYNTASRYVFRQKPVDKVEPKFHEGDIVKRKDNPHLTYILKRLTDDGDYEFHAIGKDGNEGCTCFAGVRYQDDWELVEQNPAWSEEDEKMLGAIIKDLVHPWNEYIPDRIEDEIKWLKNRLKSLSPQPKWKPSDEHIHWLKWAINRMPDTEIANDAEAELRDLLEQLNKLRAQ